MIKFKKSIKIGDIIEPYVDDKAVACVISRLVEEWDIVDAYTGEPIPLPEHDTWEWYKDITFEVFQELYDALVERLNATVPKASGEQS